MSAVCQTQPHSTQLPFDLQIGFPVVCTEPANILPYGNQYKAMHHLKYTNAAMNFYDCFTKFKVQSTGKKIIATMASNWPPPRPKFKAPFKGWINIRPIKYSSTRAA